MGYESFFCELKMCPKKHTDTFKDLVIVLLNSNHTPYKKMINLS